MNTNRYSVEEVSLEMIVTADSPVGMVQFELPISRYTSVWHRNAIPSAQISIPAGFLMTAPDQVSAAHSPIAEALSDRVQVTVYATIVTAAREGAEFLEAWPKGKFVIFEGTAVGTSWQTTVEGSVEFTVALEHWLNALTFGSSVSRTFNPENPAQFTFAAVLAAGGGGAVTPEMLVSGVAEGFITSTTIEKDMWAGDVKGQGIRAFMLEMTENESIDSPAFQQVPDQQLTVQGPNLAARAALERFEPRESDTGKYRCGVPLALNVAGSTDLSSVARAIAKDIAADTNLTLANSTYWDMLLKYAQSYMLAIIPLVDKALLVPYVPTLKTVYKTIKAEDYEASTRTMEASRGVRGVGLYGGKEYEASADVLSGAGIDYKALGIGGYFIDPERTQGTFLLLQAPPWAADVPYDPWADSSLGGGGARPFPSAVNPGTPVGGGDAAGLLGGGTVTVAAQSPIRAATDRVPFMNRLAEAMYGAEAVRGRSIDIMGRLRFDICPGSIVRLESASEKFYDTSASGELFFGAVHSVTFVLDAEASQVGTAFHIGDVRREGEFKGSLAMAQHPMWTKSWAGAPLIEEIPCQPVA